MGLFGNKKSSAERKSDKLMKQAKKADKKAKRERAKGKLPMQYKRISVADWDKRTEQLSYFRKAYADFFRERDYRENSELQEHSTQLFWHSLYLQKKRLKGLGITMDMESERVQRSDIPKESVIETDYFDGRYMVSEVNEAIYAKRTFIQNGQEIGSFRDHDSVSYSILSAKQQGVNDIICPNCGSVTTRENLIDGCDYCGTKFTVEDLEDRIGSFHFQIEVAREGVAEEARQARLLFAEDAGKMVREFDPYFSFRSFRSSVYNKMAAIHFADNSKEFSAFSADDLSFLHEQYKDIVNIDFKEVYLWDMRRQVKAGLREKNDYYVEDGVQTIICKVSMVLFGLVNGKIQLRDERIKLELKKSAACKTQNICGPSVFKCKGCGNSLSLMDGKRCHYCDREIDMMQYDWVITKYESSMSEYGHSAREFN